MDTKLNFINKSTIITNANVVFFQKNIADDFNETTVAWKVISYCGRGDVHPFIFPIQMKVSSSDSWGNFTPMLSCNNGDLFEVVKEVSGDILRYIKSGGHSTEVGIINNLVKGAINASIYKDGKLLAVKRYIAPGQKAVFEFKPTLWIGVAPLIQEGEIMSSTIISNINTEISLLGVASADIVMTGGGQGHDSATVNFKLENAVYI
jgi:hypothetical protein